MERMVGEWCLGSPIGSGSFAIVWKAKHKVTGRESAIKEINLDKLNAKLRQSLESEVSILKRINHDNIVKLLEVFEVGLRWSGPSQSSGVGAGACLGCVSSA